MMVNLLSLPTPQMHRCWQRYFAAPKILRPVFCGAILVVLAAVVSPRVFAGGAVTDSPLLETLVVSASRSQALQSDLLTNQRRAQLPGPSLEAAELLQGLPGLQIDNRTNFAQDARLSLRGFGARSAFGVRGIRLLLDGVPLTLADGQGQLSSPLLDQIDSLELLSGPLAGLYGGGAGGVLALHSRALTDTGAQLAVSGGEFGLRREAVGVRGRWGQLGASLDLAHTEQQGDRPHSSVERRQGAGRLEYETQTGLEIKLKHEQSDDPLLQDPLGLRPEQWQADPYQDNPLAENFNTRKAVHHRQSSLSLRQDVGDWHWQAATWDGRRALTQYLAFSGSALTSSGGVVDLQRDFRGANASLARDFAWDDESFTLSLGGDWSQMDDRRRGYVNDLGTRGELRRNELGQVEARAGYGLVEWRGSGHWSAFAGLRREQVDFSVDDYFFVPATDASPGNPDDSGARDYANTAFAYGVQYRLSETWQLSASRGAAAETPTLTEMAYSADSSGMNTSLRAATSHQQQLSLAYGAPSPAGARQVRLTAFAIDTRDELLVAQSINGRSIYTNAAATSRQGLELAGKWSLTSRWRLQGAATMLSAEFARGELSGKRLPGVAERDYQLQLSFLPFASERLRLGLAAQRRGAVAADDANLVSAPEFTRWDLALDGDQPCARSEYHWWLKLANLTDEHYVGSVVVNQSSGRAFEPAAGRALQLGLTLHW